MNVSSGSAQLSAISLRKAALVAGIALLVMTLLGPFSNFFVLQRLFIPGDAAATAENLVASTGLLRLGIASFLLVIILDVIVAWALYILLKPVNRSLSLLTAWFRVVYAAIFGMALISLINILPLFSGGDYLTLMGPDQIQAQTMLFFNGFNMGWNIGLIIFSLHLLLLGYLVYQSGYMPKFLGVLLIIAFVGYAVDGFGMLLLENYNLTIAMFTFLGEVVLIFWLLIRGTKIPDQFQQTKTTI